MDATDQKIVSAEAYEASLALALGGLGLGTVEIAAMLRARWPANAEAVVEELSRRGIEIAADDLTDFLRCRFSRDRFEDGEPLVARSIGWSRDLVSEALVWALANGRATLCNPPATARPLTIDDMLAGLKSADIVTRTIAGARLAMSLGAGCALSGDDAESFEYIRSPALVALLTRAVEGDRTAAAELAAMITVELPATADRLHHGRQVSRN